MCLHDGPHSLPCGPPVLGLVKNVVSQNWGARWRWGCHEETPWVERMNVDGGDWGWSGMSWEVLVESCDLGEEDLGLW